MALNRNHVAKWFTLANPPSWRCANCGAVPLQFAAENFLFRDTAATRNGRGELWFEPEHVVERFAGFASCPNRSCGEEVLVSGYTRTELEPDDPIQGPYGEVMVTYLWPSQVIPSPPMIDVPEKCPSKVAAPIQRSFDLYWTDAAATANAIRVAVEELMNHFRIPKFGRDRKGKKVRLSLHARIDVAFRARHADVADHLLAIKWIGNAGSHEAEQLSAIAVEDAFVLLDHSLHELFESRAHAKHVSRIATTVNKARRPRSGPARPK